MAIALDSLAVSYQLASKGQLAPTDSRFQWNVLAYHCGTCAVLWGDIAGDISVMAGSGTLAGGAAQGETAEGNLLLLHPRAISGGSAEHSSVHRAVLKGCGQGEA